MVVPPQPGTPSFSYKFSRQTSREPLPVPMSRHWSSHSWVSVCSQVQAVIFVRSAPQPATSSASGSRRRASKRPRTTQPMVAGDASPRTIIGQQLLRASSGNLF